MFKKIYLFLFLLLFSIQSSYADVIRIPQDVFNISDAFGLLDDDPSTQDSIIVTSAVSFLVLSPITFKSGVVLKADTPNDDVPILAAELSSNIFEMENPNSDTKVIGFKFDKGYDNSTTGGAAVRINTTTTSAAVFEDCVFTNNENDNNGNGGAIRIYGSGTSSNVFTNCNFRFNSTTGKGGAISIETTTSLDEFELCVFRDNTTNGTNAHGGAVYISSKFSGIFNSCSLISNSTTTIDSDGGALYIVQGNSTPTLTIVDCTFTSNEASSTATNPQGSGGAIYLTTAGSIVNITDCIFSTNITNSNNASATDGGGAIFITGATNATFLRCSFLSNVVNGPNDKYKGGGAIWLSGGSVSQCCEVIDCTFTGNGLGELSSSSEMFPHQNGGAIGAPLGSCLTLTNTIMENNYAGHGGAINIDQGDQVTIDGLTSRYNYAYTGGSIALDHGVSEISNSTFYGDSAFVAGGAIQFPDVSQFTFDNLIFTNCKADSFGGAIAAGGYSVTGTIQSCQFDSCYVKNTSSTSYHGTGGAICDFYYTQSDGELIVISSTFKDCFAPKYGGGIYSHRASNDGDSIISTTFSHCYTTVDNGGAIYTVDKSYIYDSCNFIGNTSAKNGGAIYLHDIYVSDADSSYIKNCTFKNNEATESGGAIYIESGPLDIFHSLLVGNICGNSYFGGGIYQGDTFDSYNKNILAQINDCTFANNTRAGYYTPTPTISSNVYGSNNIFYSNTGLGAANHQSGTGNITNTILNFTGFEFGDLTKEFSTTSGTFSNDGTTKYSGSYSLRTNPTTTNTGYVTFRNELNSSFNVTSVYGSFRFRVATLPSSSTEPIFFWSGTSFPSKFELRIQSDGRLRAYNSTGTLIGQSASSLSTNTWYLIEFYLENTSTADFLIKVNGVNEISETADLLSDNYAAISVGKTSNRNSQTVDFYYDDLSISSSGYISGARVVLLTPTSNGTNTAWTNDWDECEELPPDDATSMISTGTVNNKESFNFQNYSDKSLDAGSRIVSFKPTVRAREVAVGTPQFAILTRNGSTEDVSANITPTSTWTTYGKIYNNDFIDSNDWSLSEIDGIEIGAQHTVSSTNIVDITSVLGYVLYYDAKTPSYTYECCDSYLNTGGNDNSPVDDGTNCFSSDPKFCNTSDYNLLSTSPCIAPSGCSQFIGFNNNVCASGGIFLGKSNRNGINNIKNGIYE